MKEQITELTHPSMYAWFKEYSGKYKYMLNNSNNVLENGKLEFIYIWGFEDNLPYIKYPYGDVDNFDIAITNIMFLINSAINISDFYSWSSKKLLSFKGFPKKVEKNVVVWNDDKELYSLNYNEDRYKLYLAMWLEMFDSVTEKERWEYINEFKGKIDGGYSVIPKEILNEFGVL